jgi:hypothetical protein
MKRLLVAALVLGALAVQPGAGWSSASLVRFFHSPSGNIQCEVASKDPRGTYAYCQTFKAPRSVQLFATGRLKTCTGMKCLGDGPENAFTLAYGRSTTVGPFRCTSLTTGMRCTLPSGHGFLLGRTGLTRV